MSELWIPDTAKVTDPAVRQVLRVAALHGPDAVERAKHELLKREKQLKRKQQRMARAARKRNRSK